MATKKRPRIVAMCAATCAFALTSEGLAGSPACPADLDGSSEVDFGDLITLLAAWGPCPGCPEDLDGDDVVGFSDLLAVLTAWGPCPVAKVQPIELAGNPLQEFPHFQFVVAFNEGSSVSIAIDPRHLGASPAGGPTCNVYIVDARTLDEWKSDPALIDVRGGPDLLTFDGETIQANTFTLTDSDMLTGDAGIDIGIGYDLVCDCNANATLDAGDFIDGLSDEAGFYVVHDLTQLGPLATSSSTFSIQLLTGELSEQRIYYPTDIASLGPRPLIVIGHGGGHHFTWYDYLQEHLASYGYIVTSHPNTFPFPPAVQRVLLHTDAIIGRQDEVLGGALDGLIDSSRIAWIGHSLGGRAVVLAVDLLFDGAFVPQNYGLEDVRFVSGIGSNSIDSAEHANPHSVPYHLLYGSADGDIDGSAGCDQCQPFKHVDRAAGFRQSTYIHGADHNDFNCCGFNNFEGPARTEIGREEAQRIAKAIYLSLMKHYIEGNIPAKDYLWRQWESFRPIGAASTTTVVSIYTEAPETGKRIIDSFQEGLDPDTSSSGGQVLHDVQNIFEGRLDDNDTSFTWTPSDPMNGMTYGGFTDTTRGVVFDWSGGDRFMELELLGPLRDFSSFVHLSLRACQGTRHPETIAELADLVFTVTLRDESGNTSSIRTDAYGGGTEEPYQRTGAGAGAGWQNEFETIRIRLADLLNNGSDLDLTRIEAVRLEFGPSFGAARGRLGLDDLELTTD